jgi:hypothetical protein
VIPRRGRAAPVERTRCWRRGYRFRNGCEGRISQLKRKGLRRTRLPGLTGTQTWVCGIALAHNLRVMAALSYRKVAGKTHHPQPARSEPALQAESKPALRSGFFRGK